MKRRHASFALAPVLALLAVPGAAHAGDPPGEPEIVERRVFVRPGEEPQVFVWKGRPGERAGVVHERHAAALAGRGYLGVQLVDITPALREHFGAPAEQGVLIGHVEPGSPAEAAGLEVGDVLVRVGDTAIDTSWDVSSAVRPRQQGETVALEVVRAGRGERLTATVAEREREAVELAPFLWHLGEGGPGDELAKLDPETLAPALKKLDVVLDSPEMRERLERFRSRNEELERRLRDMEQRLVQLERKLGGNAD